MTAPTINGLPAPPQPETKHIPNKEYQRSKFEERNEDISIRFIEAAIKAMEGQDKSPKEIADCADVFWEWSQADSWTRG